LWSEKDGFTVNVTMMIKEDSNAALKKSLLACLEGYVDILKEMNISNVTIASNEKVDVRFLFTSDCSVDDLRSRRSFALKAIKAQLAASSTKSQMMNDRLTYLLTREVSFLRFLFERINPDVLSSLG